ncbi:VOC family protein [Streptomyces sp. 12297]|uniref:VOC family protein n=1 Tax=Streptomyces sp. NBC_00239 TaxID=2903640 RepID=UPI002E29AC72|nr:VOC family protein [Streptomyces sp. NBC_00239]
MLTGIVIDALDVADMERFWKDATQGRTGGLRLRFVPAEQPKPAHKNRLHLDLAGGPGWEAEVARLLALGATRVDIGQGDVPWDVLADPEGNEFCVLRPGHPGVLADSGLVAICLDVSVEEREAQEAFWSARAGWPTAESQDWGFRLRRTPTSPVSLVMGPPAAPKAARNRLRLEITPYGAGQSGEPGQPGEFLDAAGNEFHVTY